MILNFIWIILDFILIVSRGIKIKSVIIEIKSVIVRIKSVISKLLSVIILTITDFISGRLFLLRIFGSQQTTSSRDILAFALSNGYNKAFLF